MTLEEKIKEAVQRDRLCELTVRVSRYASLSEALGEPAAWQATAKYQGRETGPWGVGIRATPKAAILAALAMGASAASTVTQDSDGGVFG
jgi:hypothetical protein